jgi:hypothetical protein
MRAALLRAAGRCHTTTPRAGLVLRCAQGLLYAGAIVLVFGALGYVAERTETQHQLSEAQLAVVRMHAFNAGVVQGENNVIASATASWQAAERMQEHAAQRAAQADEALAAARAGACGVQVAAHAAAGQAGR